jgi:hypothetical protein
MVTLCRGLRRKPVSPLVDILSITKIASTYFPIFLTSYFILWLQEYTLKYEQWATGRRHSSVPRPSLRTYRVHSQLQFSPSLSMFYLRAKQTFLMSDAPFELVRVPPGVLAPFQIPASHPQPPNPDPAIFSELAFELRKQLQASLDRFAVACYQNVGTKRALCGMVGGSVIALTGTLPPLACEITFSTNRWLRLTALPGMWLGVWFLIAAFNGVCPPLLFCTHFFLFLSRNVLQRSFRYA